ncbi:MAG: cysteine--tRNA ligase [Bacillota bacterium]|nr:cysteine--tRNA ligase [Bacillota bacterium]
MKVYNTLRGQKEELQTLVPHKVSMYVCGPTTYNFIHLGNARPLVVFDTVRRYLAYRGYEVTYVQNFTDVDDKIINRANQKGEDPIKLAERYINEYFKDADRLGIQRADVHPRVSQHIPQIIDAVKCLIKKGYAYEVDGDVYYRVKAFSDYGKLSKRSVDDMLAGARVEVDDRKEEPIDFALWKKAKEGEPSWESPWGEGRPGWHIECSVMSTQYLGNTFDIHGGGADLIFPHHENEIAQAEAWTGQEFVKYWMHNGFITVNSEKMSKSLGNFFILRDILDKFPSDVVRYYLIATHYRSPLDFDDGKLEEARKALGRLKTTLTLGQEFIQGQTEAATETDDKGNAFLSDVTALQNRFIEAMDDDFNTAKAMGDLFEMSHTINSFVASADQNKSTDIKAVQNALDIFTQLGSVFAIFMESGEQDQEGKTTDALIELILKIRKQAREEKDFVLADALRDRLTMWEIKVEDSPEGSRFRYDQQLATSELMEALIQIRKDFKTQKAYQKADLLRDQLNEIGIILEDTREGVRWKFAD